MVNTRRDRQAGKSSIVHLIATVCLSLLLMTACSSDDNNDDDSANGANGENVNTDGSNGDDTTPVVTNGDDGAGDSDPVVWQEGVFPDRSLFEHQCASPRTGNDVLGRPVPDTQGTLEDEKNYLRSWSDDTYLWYDELPDIDPAGSETVTQYFDLLVTNKLTETGSRKDNFHFAIATEDYLQQSQSGVSAGYGANWIVVKSTPPREIVVSYAEPDSPADLAGLRRGDRILEVDGVDLVSDNTEAGINTLNRGLFPASLGETHEFVVRDLSDRVSTITMTSSEVVTYPVPFSSAISTVAGTVGYIFFTTHIAPAEDALVDAVKEMEEANVQDLVLDLRYNSGGLVYIASQLSYMIAGETLTSGEIFEEFVFNDKHTEFDPITGDRLRPFPFFNITTENEPLPALNLSRVYILSGSNTCSASESIINGLRGVGVEVVLIGSTTCGKPYGFYPQNNCGQTYFTIQFQGRNAQGFGEFPDGFKPQNAAGSGVPVPGCSVRDDLNNALGDPTEGRLQAALNYRLTSTCPSLSGATPGADARSSESGLPVSDGYMFFRPGMQGRAVQH